jgi:hypothetical protein
MQFKSEFSRLSPYFIFEFLKYPTATPFIYSLIEQVFIAHIQLSSTVLETRDAAEILKKKKKSLPREDLFHALRGHVQAGVASPRYSDAQTQVQGDRMAGRHNC